MDKNQRKKKIPNPRLEQQTGREQERERLQFSFKHLDENHSKFDIKNCTVEYLRALLIQIKNYSEYTEEQFKELNNRDHRHFNYWSDTSEKNGFTHLSDEIQNEYSWQFALCPQSRTVPLADWRVHGMIVGNVFYIVWLDPKHQLAPRNNRNALARRSS